MLDSKNQSVPQHRKYCKPAIIREDIISWLNKLRANKWFATTKFCVVTYEVLNKLNFYRLIYSQKFSRQRGSREPRELFSYAN